MVGLLWHASRAGQGAMLWSPDGRTAIEAAGFTVRDTAAGPAAEPVRRYVER
jgi:hypothetical protein